MRRFLPRLMFLPPLLLALAWAPVADAGSIEDVRQRLDETRAQAARVEGSRAELARDNERLAAEIATAKSAARAPLLKGVTRGRLDDLLKRARAVAERLSALDRESAALEAQARGARGELLTALDAQIAETRAAFAGARGPEQRRRFEALRALVAERQAVAQVSVSGGRRPAGSHRVELPAVPDAADASPTELRELADEVRDHTSSVRDQLQALASRLDSLRARRRMLRAELAFVRDDALFSEDERNRQVVRLRADSIQPGTARAGGGRTARDRADGTATSDTHSTAPAGGDGLRGPPAQAPAPGAAEAPPSDEAGGAEGAQDAPSGASGRNSGDDDADGAGGEFAADPEAPAGPAYGGTPSDGLPLADSSDVEPPAPMPELQPVGADEPSAIDPGQELVVEDALDSSLITGEVDDLSPSALAAQIRKVEARRRELERVAKALEARGDALEKRAEDAQKE